MYKHQTPVPLYAQMHDNEIQMLSIIDYNNTSSPTIMIKRLGKLVYFAVYYYYNILISLFHYYYCIHYDCN